MATRTPLLSFGAVLALLGAATVVGVGVAVVLRIPFLIPVVLVAVLGAGVAYILGTSMPEPPGADLAAEGSEEEPFEDPVEEADRLDSSGGPLPPPEGTNVAGAPTPAPASSPSGNDAE